MESNNIKKKKEKRRNQFFTLVLSKKKKKRNNGTIPTEPRVQKNASYEAFDRCILITPAMYGLVHRGNIQFARSSCVTTHYEDRSRSLLRLRVYNVASTL